MAQSEDICAWKCLTVQGRDVCIPLEILSALSYMPYEAMFTAEKEIINKPLQGLIGEGNRRNGEIPDMVIFRTKKKWNVHTLLDWTIFHEHGTLFVVLVRERKDRRYSQLPKLEVVGFIIKNERLQVSHRILDPLYAEKPARWFGDHSPGSVVDRISFLFDDPSILDLLMHRLKPEQNTIPLQQVRFQSVEAMQFVVSRLDLDVRQICIPLQAASAVETEKMKVKSTRGRQCVYQDEKGSMTDVEFPEDLYNNRNRPIWWYREMFDIRQTIYLIDWTDLEKRAGFMIIILVSVDFPSRFIGSAMATFPFKSRSKCIQEHRWGDLDYVTVNAEYQGLGVCKYMISTLYNVLFATDKVDLTILELTNAGGDAGEKCYTNQKTRDPLHYHCTKKFGEKCTGWQVSKLDRQVKRKTEEAPHGGLGSCRTRFMADQNILW